MTAQLTQSSWTRPQFLELLNVILLSSLHLCLIALLVTLAPLVTHPLGSLLSLHQTLYAVLLLLESHVFL